MEILDITHVAYHFRKNTLVHFLAISSRILSLFTTTSAIQEKKAEYPHQIWSQQGD